jgi:GT2 family glycosyltransferase
MYGEDADLCLRARRLGARPLLCPDARIIHLGGRSEQARDTKVVRLLRARVQLLERHWPRRAASAGRLLHALWVLRRSLVWSSLAPLGIGGAAQRGRVFRTVWARRREWLSRQGANA